MITITACTAADSATVAALWNAKTSDAGSCWYQAAPVDAAFVAQLMDGDYTFSLAQSDGAAVGFGFWRGPQLVAFCGDTDQVYYRLMQDYATAGVAAGTLAGVATIGAGATRERGWMDALEVIQCTPIGFAPLAAGQDPSERVATVLEVTCDLGLLADTLAARLEGTS